MKKEEIAKRLREITNKKTVNHMQEFGISLGIKGKDDVIIYLKKSTDIYFGYEFAIEEYGKIIKEVKKPTFKGIVGQLAKINGLYF